MDLTSSFRAVNRILLDTHHIHKLVKSGIIEISIFEISFQTALTIVDPMVGELWTSI